MRLTPFLATLLAATLSAAARPRLVVVISVDQFSADLMARWGKDLPGGLGRLYREGSTFLDAYHDHGYTETGPGHSVLLTGRHPMHTGITENAWWDRAAGHYTYCADDPAGTLLGVQGTPAGPANLDATTLGEWLAAQVKGSRSFAVSGKDRSAILMAGHRAQGVYWFAGAGGFTSSEAYARTLPGWLVGYNTAFLARTASEELTWGALDPHGLPEPATYLINGQALTMALPRPLHAAGAPLDKAFWNRYRSSPFFDEAILGAAEALATAEHLGEGPSVDLLALGMAATDFVGHTFGNSGPEMLDNLRRLDRNLGTYLDHLKAKVPDLWVVLTADHGAADFPERSRALGIPSGRVDAKAWASSFNRELTRKLGGAHAWFLPSYGQQLYLDPADFVPGGPSRAQVLAAAVAVAKATPEVAEACSGDALAAFEPDPNETPDHRSLATKLRLSYVPGRSGDLLLAFKPYYYVGSGVAGHGHPYDYDRRVPLIFWGPWRAERRTEPVRTVDLAPTLAKELGIKPTDTVDGRVLVLKR